MGDLFYLPYPYPHYPFTFAEPVDRATVSDQTIALKDAAGNAVPGAFSFSPDGAVVTLFPAARLASETLHTLTVGSGIRDLQGYSLEQAVTSTFTVRDTTPPPPPPAGAITATFPDAEGMITVTATQGSAEPDCTVLVINDTSGEIVSVSPQTNGSFTARISAQLGDEIQVVLMDAAGNQTLVSYLTFKAPDGRYLVTAKGGKVEGEGGLLLDIPEGALVGPAVVKITPVLESALPHPVPAEGRFLAALNVDTGGIPFQKEVHLSIPVPADLPEGAVPFLAQPRVHVNPDGTEEEVYAVIDSTKIVNGRLTTASPPFDGPMGFGIFTFLFTPAPLEGPVIVSGTTYRDMDGLPGYMAGVDQPIEGAVIRCPAADNFISYSDANGHYASYGFTAADVCRDFDVTAIHPQTMFRNTIPVQTCTAPYIVNNLNFKLADKDTQVPDDKAPAIEINLKIAPGQENTFAAGTIPLGTELELPVGIIDRDVASATLTVEFKTPDMPSPQVYPMVLDAEGDEIHTVMTDDSPALRRFFYRPRFSSPIMGNRPEYFRPERLGTYTFVVEAADDSGNRATRRIQVRAIDPGQSLESIDGAPMVDEILPGDGAEEIMVTTPVVVTFSEPVTNVTSATFRLFDIESQLDVPAYLYTSIEGGRMRATLQPKNNLHYGRQYEIILTEGITDVKENPSFANVKLALDKEYRAAFRTKEPRAFALADDERFTEGRDIALYTHLVSGKTYAYIAAGTRGWRIVDVTDPTRPTVVKSFDYSNSGQTVNYRGLAIDEQTGLLATVEEIRFAGGGQYGYVRFHDLSHDPVNPEKFGQEKLAEAFSGIPIRVALYNGHAYISTVEVGLQVVDIEAARNHEGISDGSTIVGLFDSLGQGYGNISDIRIYEGGKALLVTSRGAMLILDLAIPAFPQLISDYTPEEDLVGRAAVSSGYSFTDADGISQSIDLALVATRKGLLHTFDLSDPYTPRLIGTATDEAGSPVTTLALDIVIGRSSGLAFVTTLNAIQVFDIKNPYEPRLLQTLTTAPDEDGNDLLVGFNPALVEKDGWVYMANKAEGLRVVDFDPVGLSLYCEEEQELGLQEVSSTFCRDYYPVLGEKKILIKGVDANGGPLNAQAKVVIMENTRFADLGILVSREATFKDGIAELTLSTTAGYKPSDSEEPIVITYQMGTDAETARKNGTYPPDLDPLTLRIRSNANVTFDEVLRGEAVYVAGSEESKTTKKTVNGKEVETKRLDYVQELLNQVVPRKRSVKGYELLTEDGQFAGKTETVVRQFRENFAMDNTNIAFTKDAASGLVTYAEGDNADNTSAIFRKLSKYYSFSGYRDPAKIGSVKTYNLNKIVDRETLVGRIINLYVGSEGYASDLAMSSPDQLINAPVGGGTDTGLYELYINVVKRFVDGMIEAAERYAGKSGFPTPTDNWFSRGSSATTGYGPANCVAGTECSDSHGSGMSYSYGGRQTIEEFNSTVSKWKAPPSSLYNSIALTSVNNYRGNLNDTIGAIDTSITRGSKRWAGLYSERPGTTGTEYNAWVAFKNEKDAAGKLKNNEREHPFAPYYWAGIDCSGLVLQSLRHAEQQAEVSLGEICTSYDKDKNACNARIGIDTNTGLSDTSVSRFFNDGNKGVVFYYFANDKEGDNVEWR